MKKFLIVPALIAAVIGAVVATQLHQHSAEPRSATSSSNPQTALVLPADRPLLEAGLATSQNGTLTIDPASASALLNKIPSGQGHPASEYQRNAFGPAWADVDHNGCDTRNDILRRDLTSITLKPNTRDCVVLTGRLLDPYSGTEINFIRGQRTSTAVQIDHLVPLGLAWQDGASAWNAQQREAFANDPTNLTAVDGPANEQKSDDGPSQWLPANAAYRCIYVARFVLVAADYQLTLSTADHSAIQTELDRCA